MNRQIVASIDSQGCELRQLPEDGVGEVLNVVVAKGPVWERCFQPKLNTFNIILLSHFFHRPQSFSRSNLHDIERLYK